MIQITQYLDGWYLARLVDTDGLTTLSWSEGWIELDVIAGLFA